MNVKETKVASFAAHAGVPARIAFTMTRLDLLRLSWNALLAAARNERAIAISSDELSVVDAPRTTSPQPGSK